MWLKRRHEGVFIVLALGVLSFQSLRTAWTKSVTFDEVGNLAAGYSYLKTWDFRLYSVNPPLVKQISALPLLLMDVRLPLDHWSWTEEYKDHTEFGEQLLFHYNRDGHKFVFWGRFMVHLLSLTLGMLVYLFARELFGVPTAMAALGMFVVEPNIIAHSSLATTDLGFTLFLFAAVYLFFRWEKKQTWGRFVLMSVVFGLALSSKLTAWVLVPTFFLIHCLAQDTKFAGQYLGMAAVVERVRNLIHAAMQSLGLVFLAIVIALTVVFADYGFEVTPAIKDRDDRPKLEAKLDQWGIRSENFRERILSVAEHTMIPARPYFSSLALMAGMTPRLQNDGSNMGYRKYLMGKRSSNGFWYFPFVAVLLKLTIPMIILIFGAISMVRYLPRTKWSYLVLPIAMLLLISLKKHSFAFRYINLPALPFMIVLASSFMVRVFWQRRWMRLVSVFLLFWMIVSAARIHPHYLAYFNEIAGGAENGYKYMVNSNLDWGQDLKLLKRYLRKNGIERIYLSYFGPVDPAYYGIEYKPLLGVSSATFRSHHVEAGLPPTGPVSGWIAISATCLQNIEGFYPDASYDWLRKYEPVARIGYSIFIYYVPEVDAVSVVRTAGKQRGGV